MNRRDTSLDIVRILACFMVVLMHSPIPSGNVSGPFLAALSYFTAPCIGLFFMVSGALLLPVRTDYITFIRKRFSKILVPTLLWSLIYIGLKLYTGKYEINVLQSFASLPFSPQGEGVLWFMYTLAGLYLLSPILGAWVEKASQRELQIVLMLWCVTLCYPLLSFYVTTNTSTTGILYYFTGYAGYFLLGYYMKKYPESISAAYAWILAAAGVALLLVLKHQNVQFDFYSLFWYESIFIAALAVAIWKLVAALCNVLCVNTLPPPVLSGSTIDDTYALSQYNLSTANKRSAKWLALLSNVTFGVYLIHILIMRYCLWHQEWILSISNYPLQCLLIATITMLLSVAACILIAKCPESEWLIGYHMKKS